MIGTRFARHSVMLSRVLTHPPCRLARSPVTNVTTSLASGFFVNPWKRLPPRSLPRAYRNEIARIGFTPLSSHTPRLLVTSLASGSPLFPRTRLACSWPRSHRVHPYFPRTRLACSWPRSHRVHPFPVTHASLRIGLLADVSKKVHASLRIGFLVNGSQKVHASLRIGFLVYGCRLARSVCSLLGVVLSFWLCSGVRRLHTHLASCFLYAECSTLGTTAASLALRAL